jgi:hypothetical protein
LEEAHEWDDTYERCALRQPSPEPDPPTSWWAGRPQARSVDQVHLAGNPTPEEVFFAGRAHGMCPWHGKPVKHLAWECRLKCPRSEDIPNKSRGAPREAPLEDAFLVRRR